MSFQDWHINKTKTKVSLRVHIIKKKNLYINFTVIISTVGEKFLNMYGNPSLLKR